MPYRVMIEINQVGDPTDKMEDQPSLIYQVEVDNYDPYIAFSSLSWWGIRRRRRSKRARKNGRSNTSTNALGPR